MIPLSFAPFVVSILLMTVGISSGQKAEDHRGKNLKNKNFAGQVLPGAIFTDADLSWATFESAVVKGADFRGANLDSTKFFKADVTGADFRGSTGEYYGAEADFSKANMEGLKFRFAPGATYSGANLKKTKISGLAVKNNCTNADFCGANLRELQVAEWNENRFRGAIFDDNTAFPPNFDPKAYGMVHKNEKELEKEGSKETPKTQGVMERIPADGNTRRPSSGAKVQDTASPARPTRVAMIKQKPLPNLAPLAPKPMSVIGRAVFEDGRPIPDFTVGVLGFDGELNLFAGSLPSLGKEAGSQGRYSVPTTDTLNHKKPVAGHVVAVVASAKLRYKGHEYTYELHPIDGKLDGTTPAGFRGESGKGVVRDFVMKMTGPRRGYDPSELSETRHRSAMFGGSIAVDCRTSQRFEYDSALVEVFAPESMIDLKLEPTGPLLDGSSGEVIIRQFALGKKSGDWHDHYLRSIPIGEYNATATLREPGRAPIPLRMKLTSDEQPQVSATILWVPVRGNLGEIRLYLVK